TVFNNVAPNSYTLTVKDATGCCIAASTIIVATPTAPAAPRTTVVDPTCTVATGTIIVTAPLGAQYTYSIDGINFQASTVFNNVEMKRYTFTVQDERGCSSSATITVNPAPGAQPTPTASVVDPTCT